MDRLLFKVLIGIFCLVIPLTCKHKRPITWEKTYGGEKRDLVTSVEQTCDGGYIVAGCTGSSGAGKGDIWLIKTDSRGRVLWTQTYGGSDADLGGFVQQTKDEGYIVIGCTGSYGMGGDVYLIKTDSKGETLWTKTYGGYKGDIGGSVQQTMDNGYILTGGTHSYGAGKSDIWLIRTDFRGDTIWTKTFGGSGNELGVSVKQTADKGYIVAGYTESYGAGKHDIWLIKTDSRGDTLWTKTYGGNEDDWGGRVEQTTDSGYIVVGQTFSYGINGDVWLIKTDSKGDTLWTRVYGGKGKDRGYSAHQTRDGGYIVTGYAESYGAGGRDLWLIKTDAKGDTLWTKTYGGNKEDLGVSVQQTTDGGYIIAGRTSSYGAGERDAYLIKTDSLGNVRIER